MLKTKNKECENLVIFTGGKSSRMGSDKASLPFGQYSVIEYMIRKFRNYFKNIYISVAKQDDLSHLSLEQYGVEKICDVIPGCGPMGGLYSVFKKTDLEDFCVCAVDMPFADPVILKQCVPDCGEDAMYCIAVHDEGKTEPLYGWYSRKMFDLLEQCISKKEFRLMGMLAGARGRLNKVNHNLSFFNMNDRTSYYEALKKVLKPDIPMISFAAWSGTGKTTYIEKMIPYLKERGLRVAVIKHDGHDFEMDVEGKDTDRFYKAGAETVVISSPKKIAGIHKWDKEEALTSIAEKIEDVDLIIVEGYKSENQPKIELHRSDISTKLMENLTNRVAIISDFPWEMDVPVFFLQDFSKVADFLCEFANKHNM